jgi:perosamine synthetase
MIHVSEVVLSDEEINAVNTVLKSNHLVQGAVVGKLESSVAKYCDVGYAVAFNSGTAALHTALFASGVVAGDEVITTPFSFVATANAIVMQGAVPVFADIDQDYFHITAESIQKKITPKTKAVLVVDLYGQAVDYDAIKKVCDESNLLLIADSCQALGAEYDGQKIGSLADITVFSLYATKNIMSGEGGLLTTNNDEYAERARLFRSHGQDAQYSYQFLGYNYRLTDVLAAIAVKQLETLEDKTHKRNNNAAYLTKKLSTLKGIQTPRIRPGTKHAFHQYTIKITDDCSITREKLQKILTKSGVESRIYYPTLLAESPHLHTKDRFPVAEVIKEQVLSLPVHPGLRENDLDVILETIGAAL